MKSRRFAVNGIEIIQEGDKTYINGVDLKTYQLKSSYVGIVLTYGLVIGAAFSALITYNVME